MLTLGPKMRHIPHFWCNNFPHSVTFIWLLNLNFMQKIRKNEFANSEKTKLQLKGRTNWGELIRSFGRVATSKSYILNTLSWAAPFPCFDKKFQSPMKAIFLGDKFLSIIKKVKLPYWWWMMLTFLNTVFVGNLLVWLLKL